MSEQKQCARCGDYTPTINNLLETSFGGFIGTETTIETTKSVHVSFLYTKGHGVNTEVKAGDDKYELCSSCWSDFIGEFMQNRDCLKEEKV